MRSLKLFTSSRARSLFILATGLGGFVLSAPSIRAATRDIKIRGQIIFPQGYPPGDLVVLYVKNDSQTSEPIKKSPSKTWVIDQKNYTFVPALVVASPQDTLVFKNSDPDLHTVVSHSGPLRGKNISTLKGQSKSLTLKELGHSEILCGIHAQMRADLLVIPTRNFIVSRPDGSFEGTLKAVNFPLQIQVFHPLLVASALSFPDSSKIQGPLKIELSTQD